MDNGSNDMNSRKPMVETLAVILPAAGQAKRMRGGDKLLEEVDGEPLLRRLSRFALQTVPLVSVAVPDLEGPRAAALEGLAVTAIPVPDADQGMARSLVRALSAVPHSAAGVMILPADMPEITAEDIGALAGAFAAHGGSCIIRAAAVDGTPGHPVIFPASCRAELEGLTGDTGARAVLKAHAENVRDVPLPARHALVDLDTPEEWAAWRADQAASSALH